MGLVDGRKLRTNYEGLVERLATDPSAGIVRPYVSTRLVRDVTIECSFEQYGRSFSFTADEAVSRGGQELGPSPMRYFLSGIAFCMQGWWAKGSAMVGCELESLELDVHTYMDMRGEHGLQDVPAHPQWLLFNVHVHSSNPTERVLEMIDWGNARCPLGSFGREAVPIYERITHNGRVVRDNVPARINLATG